MQHLGPLDFEQTLTSFPPLAGVPIAVPSEEPKQTIQVLSRNMGCPAPVRKVRRCLMVDAYHVLSHMPLTWCCLQGPCQRRPLHCEGSISLDEPDDLTGQKGAPVPIAEQNIALHAADGHFETAGCDNKPANQGLQLDGVSRALEWIENVLV